MCIITTQKTLNNNNHNKYLSKDKFIIKAAKEDVLI